MDEEKEKEDNGVSKVKSNIHCLNIIGQIEGHNILSNQTKTTKYEHVIPQLIELEEDDEIEGLLVILNTVGGDVEAGLAISELIAGMKKPSVSLVLGGGHSIGVPLAASTNYSFIAPSATMTIHPVRTNGLIIGAPQVFEYFNKLQENITKFIVNHSNTDHDTLTRLMFETNKIANDMGTVLFGEETVKYGIINETGTISDALKKLKELIEENK